MFEDEEEPKEWEIKDEEPPESLRRKWEKEETSAKRSVVCPSCKKETPAEGLACIFCGTALPQGACPFRCFFTWVKSFFKGS